MTPSNDDSGAFVMSLPEIAQRASVPHVVSPPAPPTAGATVPRGEAMTPLKESTGHVGVTLQAGAPTTGATSSPNLLRLGGDFAGLLEVNAPGASEAGPLIRGNLLKADGESSRFMVVQKGRAAAYFGLGPSLLPTGPEAPALTFLSPDGKLSSAFTSGISISYTHVGASVFLGGQGLGSNPDADGLILLNSKDGRRSLKLSVENRTPHIEGPELLARLAAVETRALLVMPTNNDPGAGGGVIFVRNKANQPTITINGDDGDIILHNADCAEDFDVRDDAELAPGCVAILAEDGKLMESEQAFDDRVVGVVSGAGAYKPAFVLDRQECDRRRRPIALMGKVFCMVDAREHPIRPGDLLTTSSTRGHAMAVMRADRSRAQGAVLGKALAGLDGGCGLIPMLVSPC